MRTLRSIPGLRVLSSAAILATVLLPAQASAQGCILTRNTSPVLGSQIGPYLDEGEWQAAVLYRQFTADDQYQGTELSPVVTANDTAVISKMSYSEVTASYALSRQWNASVTLPVILKASSNRALPSTVAGSPRFEQSTSGIGDTMLTLRRWMLSCDKHETGNFALGLGLKLPTGESNAMDTFPNARGEDERERVVDQSIQLGDSGWGFALSVEGFTQIGKLTAFASSVYLFNPKDQNETFSPPAMLNPAGPGAVAEVQRYNTVSDSYLVRAGLAFPLFFDGLSMSLAGRIEGVPVNDAFGDTAGFRRPGYFLALEPGIVYGRSRTTLAINVPIRMAQDVKPSLGFARDSTFADYTVLASASVRFGGKS